MRVLCMAALCALMITGCKSKKEHEQEFCSALTALNDDLSALAAIGPSSTIYELRTVISKLERDSRVAAKQGHKVGTPTAKQFTQSVDQLDVDSRSLSGNMTVAQAQTRIAGDVNSVTRTAQALAQESGCPDAMRSAPSG